MTKRVIEWCEGSGKRANISVDTYGAWATRCPICKRTIKVWPTAGTLHHHIRPKAAP